MAAVDEGIQARNALSGTLHMLAAVGDHRHPALYTNTIEVSRA